jgi:hypothetical protein
VGFYTEGFGQLTQRARLGTMFLIFEFIDVVESHTAPLAQLTQAEHPAPSKLPQLRPVYLYESLNHNQQYTYFLLTNQRAYERILVS